jgi:hypothetical protein
VLDLKLALLTPSWNLAAIEPDSSTSFCTRLELVCATKPVVSLRHAHDDYVEAYVQIQDPAAFLRLVASERKDLIAQLVDGLESHLFGNVSVHGQNETQQPFSRGRLRITVLIANLTWERGNGIVSVPLPDKRLGYGLAGYVDHTFTYSNPYFLDLALAQNVREANDAASFTVERE